MASSHPVHVVVAGGGPAGVEALLALRDLAGDRVRLTLVAPDHDLELKPFRVATPFAADHARTYPLADLARDVGAQLVRDVLVEVRPDEHVVVLGSGEHLDYDAVVVAVGARARAPFPRALVFGTAPRSDDLNDVLSDLEGGYSRSVAFVVPPGVNWPLPLYELALMTVREVRSMGIDDAQVTVVTPEATPLAVFGPVASGAVAELLAQAGIVFRGGAFASVEDGGLRLRPGDEVLTGFRTVTVPVLEGPGVTGLPADDHGFLAIDEHARVRGTTDVYAAGDGADFPVKQGGLGCQQADAAAFVIAAAAGAPVQAEPFRPVLRGKLLTGRGAEYLRTSLAGGDGEGRADELELWWPPSKLSGRWLSPHLAWVDAGRREGPIPSAAPAASAPEAGPGHPDDVEVDVGVELADLTPAERRAAILSFDPYSAVARR
jgi:sulfide:quinone oxidoreductase